MKKIFSLTTSSFLGPFIATFFVVLFVLLVQFLWKYIDDMVGKGFETSVILQLLFYQTATFIPLALPLAILLSSIMTFGKLAETNELMALKCSGISLLRIMLPLITIVTLMSAADFYIANSVIPAANLKSSTLLHDVRSQRQGFAIKEGVFFNGIPNYSIYVKKKDKVTNEIYGVKIYDHSHENGTGVAGNDIVMTATSGKMNISKDSRWLNIKLLDGYRFEEMPPSGRSRSNFPFNRTHFMIYDMKFDLSAFKLARTNESIFKDNYAMLNIRQLDYYKDSLTKVADGFKKNIVAASNPYFQYIRDTGYFLHKHIKATVLKPTEQIINMTEKTRQRGTIINALVNARNIKSFVDSEGGRVTEYEKYIVHYDIEWHRKFALSLACLTLFFIGAPLGAIIRKGGIGLPTVVSIIMFLVFYLVSIMGEKSAKQEVIPAYIGMWIPTVILMPVGFFLTWRANMDKISFSTDGFKRFYKKVSSLFKSKKISASI